MSTTIEHVQDNIDRTLSGLKDGLGSAAASVDQAQDSVRDGVQKAAKIGEDFMAFSQGTLEAIAQSSQVFTAGMQEIGQMFAAAAKASMDETVSTFQAMAGVKSVRAAMDLQAGLLRSAAERAVSHGSQLADSSMKLSQQTFAPIGARLSLAAEKFGRIG